MAASVNPVPATPFSIETFKNELMSGKRGPLIGIWKQNRPDRIEWQPGPGPELVALEWNYTVRDVRFRIFRRAKIRGFDGIFRLQWVPVHLVHVAKGRSTQDVERLQLRIDQACTEAQQGTDVNTYPSANAPEE